MTTVSFREIEQLSAWLDGQLPAGQVARLESRLASDQQFAALLEDLRFSRTILRRTPQRRAPRNFTLTPKTAGIRAPLPRLVPAFSWASAVAALLFVITVGSNLFSGFPATATQPMMVAAPLGMGGGGAETYDAGGGLEQEVLPEEPAIKNGEEVPPAMAEDVTAAGTSEQPPAAGDQERSSADGSAETRPTAHPWSWIWSTLALLFIAAALLLRWGSQWAFKRKLAKK